MPSLFLVSSHRKNGSLMKQFIFIELVYIIIFLGDLNLEQSINIAIKLGKFPNISNQILSDK